MKKVLLLDANNLIYRARYSAKFSREGDAAIVYSFFRSLRPLVEKFNPDVCYFVRDGRPSDRLELFPDYKSNRVREVDESFMSQKRMIENIVNDHFPITVCRNMEVEADDLIAYLVLKYHKSDECVVISSDTDFIQLLQEHENCSLYNPISKKFRECPDYDYLTWKSLRGDSSDNIPGIPRVGDKTAAKLAMNSDLLKEFFEKDSNNKVLYERNRELISFREIDNLDNTFVGESESNFEEVRNIFENLKFNSMIKDKSWKKYIDTFSGVSDENFVE